MRKQITTFYLFLILAFTLAGCGRTAPTMQPTQIEQLPTLTLIPPTSTLVPTIIPSITLTPIITIAQPPSPTLKPTKTMTPINTLEPEKASEIIKTLLQEPVDCAAPCFWGIVPGQTSNEEARSIFSHLGLQMASKTYEGKGFSSIHYVLDSGLSNWVTLTIQNNIVENIRIQISPETQKMGVPRDWLAYSPETLIKRYGTPSQVDIGIDWGPNILFTMTLYFDDVDLIVDYSSTNFSYPNENRKLEVCPLTDQFDSAWLWMGKNPVYPPGQGVPLETVASMTMDEFSKLLTGDSKDACFIVNGDVFK